MRFYSSTTSDTGKVGNKTTRGGNRQLVSVVTINTPDGRSMIRIVCEAGPWGRSTVRITKSIKGDKLTVIG
jgi:hypothetical protein